MRLAEELRQLNEERKVMTEQGIAQAIREIEQKELMQDAVLVVYLPAILPLYFLFSSISVIFYNSAIPVTPT